jgi:prevent-host-death family protein
MAEHEISIGRVKRDISELVNRVAYGGERIILTSRGKPKAALVSIEDYERLQRGQPDDSLAHWQAWAAQSDALASAILARRGAAAIDVDELLQQEREEQEQRDAQRASSD